MQIRLAVVLYSIKVPFKKGSTAQYVSLLADCYWYSSCLYVLYVISAYQCSH